MLMVNWTGLSCFHWVPRYKHRFDDFGLWYVEVKWLGIQATAYSVNAGKAIVQMMNEFQG